MPCGDVCGAMRADLSRRGACRPSYAMSARRGSGRAALTTSRGTDSGVAVAVAGVGEQGERHREEVVERLPAARDLHAGYGRPPTCDHKARDLVSLETSLDAAVLLTIANGGRHQFR